MASTMKLYSYWRSSAAYRVRIALGLKELTYDYYPVNLAHGGGEQFSAEFVAVNPNSKLPAIVDDGFVVFDSNAILLYRPCQLNAVLAK